MGIFGKKRQSPHQSPVRLPVDMPRRMEKLGRFEMDPQGSGIDSTEVLSECVAPFYEYSKQDPAGFIAAVRAIVLPIGGVTIYGGLRCVTELLGWALDDPNYLDLLDDGIGYKRSLGLPPIFLTGYEWQRWLDVHGPNSW